MRDLTGLFAPDRVAVVGATPREGSLGRALTENLLKDFDGDVVPVNPNHETVLGVSSVPRIADAGDVDLAVVAVPAAVVPDVLRDAGEAGVLNVVVISAGFGDAGEEGAALGRELRAVADDQELNLVGPNSLGVISTGSGLNATFAQSNARDGSVSMLSQSGAFVTAALDWATDHGIGFRDVVSLGNEAVLTETDFLVYWADDPGTDVIVGYLEGIESGRAFVDRVREVTADTPVVLIKAGGSKAGARAAASHTGAMAGSDRAYDAGFEQAGVLRAATVEELFDVAATLAGQPLPTGNGVGVVSNAGGAGVLTSDAIAETQLSLTELGVETEAELRSVLPPAADATNPVDVVGDAGVDRFRRALSIVTDDPGVDVAVLLSAPTAIFDFEALATAVMDVRSGRDVPIVTCLMGGDRVEPAVSQLRRTGIPNFFDPARAITAIAAMDASREIEARSYAEPKHFDDGEWQVDPILDDAVERRGGRLSVEAMGVLDEIGIPRPDGALARTAEAATAIAAEFDSNAVLKIASPDVLHKSDVGGVEVGVPVADVSETFDVMIERVRDRRPDAAVMGVWVEEAVDVTSGVETIVGVTRDAQFGPLVMFGLGGIFVEVFEDVSFRVAPVSGSEAREMTEEITASPMLRGARGRPSVDLDAIVDTICRLSWLAIAFPRISELDVNPLLATADGVSALDFRLTVRTDGGSERTGGERAGNGP